MSDILICDRDDAFATSLQRLMAECGYTAEVLGRPDRALQKLRMFPFRAMIVGVYADDAESLETIPMAHRVDDRLPIVAVGDRESLSMERQVRQRRVFYYAVRPVNPDEVREAVERAVRRRGSLYGREG